jgi:hypothetical protein
MAVNHISAEACMMAIGGGPITTLLTSPNVAAIGLSASRVYVTDGTVMRGFPKAGGAEALNFDAGAKVTAMYVAPGSPGAVIYRVQANAPSSPWATAASRCTTERCQAVRRPASRSTAASCGPTARAAATTIAACARARTGTTTVVSAGGVGSRYVQGDGRAMFWGDLSKVSRYVH